MSTITSFDGMSFKMYFKPKEHEPPHMVIFYGEKSCEINIKTLDIRDGILPKAKMDRANEWIEKHRDELLEMWSSQIFHKIKPLNAKKKGV